MNNPISHHTNPQLAIIAVLRELIHTRGREIDAWFAGASRQTPPFFYNSVDLRHSGFKLAPVDTNLFPAGFNNLTPTERKEASRAAHDFFRNYHPKVTKVLLLSEDHTRNTYYLENLAVLQQILSDAGKEVRLSNLSVSATGEKTSYESKSGIALTAYPIIREGRLVKTKDGFVPDLILVNNDMTEGAPEILQDIEQTVTPPIGFGWYQRRKTSHFESYNNLARDFCHQFDLDPWFITTIFEKCGVVNFKEKKGIECVALKVDKALHRIQAKYDEYGITGTPYVFIKSDRGTYGMGIMTVRSGDEVIEMNKDIRKKMNTIKGGTLNTEVIIQEGIPTIDIVGENPAEPMMYLVGGQPVGCIFRLNTKRDAYGNLNASGMQFASIKETGTTGVCEALGLISKLASYAAAWECYVESYHI